MCKCKKYAEKKLAKLAFVKLGARKGKFVICAIKKQIAWNSQRLFYARLETQAKNLVEAQEHFRRKVWYRPVVCNTFLPRESVNHTTGEGNSTNMGSASNRLLLSLWIFAIRLVYF